MVVQETAFIPGERVSPKNEGLGPTDCDRKRVYSISLTSPSGALPMVSSEDVTICECIWCDVKACKGGIMSLCGFLVEQDGFGVVAAG